MEGSKPKPSKWGLEPNAFKKGAKEGSLTYAPIPNKINDDPRLNPVEFRVLVALARYSPIYPSYYDLMDMTGLSYRHITDAIKNLKEFGLIDYYKGKSGFNNDYKINSDGWDLSSRDSRVGRGTEQKAKDLAKAARLSPTKSDGSIPSKSVGPIKSNSNKINNKSNMTPAKVVGLEDNSSSQSSRLDIKGVPTPISAGPPSQRSLATSTDVDLIKKRIAEIDSYLSDSIIGQSNHAEVSKLKRERDTLNDRLVELDPY